MAREGDPRAAAAAALLLADVAGCPVRPGPIVLPVGAAGFEGATLARRSILPRTLGPRCPSSKDGALGCEPVLVRLTVRRSPLVLLGATCVGRVSTRGRGISGRRKSRRSSRAGWLGRAASRCASAPALSAARADTAAPVSASRWAAPADCARISAAPSPNFSGAWEGIDAASIRCGAG